MDRRNHPPRSAGAGRQPPHPPVFAARLFAHRSLGRGGYVALMAVIGGVCLAYGLFFLSIGAWPVMGFFGLDVLLVWAAFRLNYRAARAYEEVAVWPHDLRVRQVSAGGRVREHSFNPFWTRFRVDRHQAYGITRMLLTGEGRQLAIGGLLNPVDRESFATAFSTALSRVKGG
ncbi:MAG: membrane protein [Alphaproteobacteria bacterium]|nr:MAG: membrane protein [Alphaproteobacteria bacterium]